MQTSNQVHTTGKHIRAVIPSAQNGQVKINLLYVTDSDPGIARKLKRKIPVYHLNGIAVTDQATLARIKSLVIPPAWQRVWICTKSNGHLQATGFDIQNRKQYRYHPHWSAMRNDSKFNRMQRFGEVLPSIREQLKKDLAKPGLPQEKVLALIVSLLEHTHIRVGSQFYEKLYGSFGLTTLKDKHVEIQNSTVKLSFKGKKGVLHNISFRSKRMAQLVQKCKDIPGKELFQYYDKDGNRHVVDSGMVNAYLKQCCGEDFTAKDFRTWAGTLLALLYLKEVAPGETLSETKSRIVDALDHVAGELGNTRTVAKKYYVNPSLLDLYSSNKLHEFINDWQFIESGECDLSDEEQLLLTLLSRES